MHAFEKIRGIGPQTAKNLVEHGFSDVGTIAGASAAELAAVPGFSLARAEKTIEAAKALTASGETGAAPEKGAEYSSREEGAGSKTTQHEGKGEETEGTKGSEGKKAGKAGKGKKAKKEKKETKEKKSGKGKRKKKKKK